eukprot:CAMPEP_0198339350 /NCGR_PEP_ID=MMETSP1450-20131203/39428_1 /TAXON_ID=753684 ORGANISM="Madagascaria erythrocladiodes, Strain CCMP3234" /NCGR_SAMPLE_ID=MMETSP1450 /ASSEMBLY_ACC=CAM_ASM_001115 /LENGTH=84 /DNA_ID=CAMNT_0044044275 /DNA_START=37 /DNA_END=291 /DNA_ORIENTATION=-
MASQSSELKVAEKWDAAIESGIKRMAYGSLAGAATAGILFRSSVSRAAVIGLAIGVGLGMTYSEVKQDFESLSGPSDSSVPVKE